MNKKKIVYIIISLIGLPFYFINMIIFIIFFSFCNFCYWKKVFDYKNKKYDIQFKNEVRKSDKLNSIEKWFILI